MSVNSAKVQRPLSEKFIELFQTMQFVWYSGHIVTLTSGFFYILTFKKFWYRLLYLSVLESFGVIIYQLYFKPKNPISLNSALLDDNLQYFGIAFFFLINSVCYPITIIPFLFFAVFHTLNYTRTCILPLLVDQENEESIKNSRINSISNSILNFTKNYNDKSMKLSSNVEIFTFFWFLIKSIFFRKNAWISLVVYSIFIKLRFENSIYIRNIFKNYEVRFDGLISHPNVPPIVKKIWLNIKISMKKIGSIPLAVPKSQPSSSHSQEETTKTK
ncbi:hypothetical protein PACTADRAFT_50851 [Pachysolen tannophilus NRRL Y-2460]|uniref:Nucleoporin POM33 n=1 Tax=Pachysolen tannophilus NRRL Y-2460 TaxID=669874 RepID=A0A1E4TTB1_PACTA|nr:hypothetical protein PACTADRAFT_50851 [Pachysolen tannophilus NRRL Y-2460]